MAGFGLPNFGQLTKPSKAQEIQQNAQALQDELDGMEIEARVLTGEPASGCPAISNPGCLGSRTAERRSETCEASTLEAPGGYEQSTADERRMELTGG